MQSLRRQSISFTTFRGSCRREAQKPDINSSRGRGRQHYAITATGRERFLELMQKEHLNDADNRDMFRIKVGNFNRVPVEVGRSIIRHYLALLAEISAHAQAMSERVAKVPEMGDAERVCILLALGQDRFLAESDRKWVQEQMAHFL